MHQMVGTYLVDHLVALCIAHFELISHDTVLHFMIR
jgi:hypothetical protein